jgi:hypothetical protein
MLALSLRFPREHDPKKKLQALARVALDATLEHEPTGPGLQRDAGVPLELEIRRDDQHLALLASAASDEVDEIVLWDANNPLPLALSLEHAELRWAAAETELGSREALIIGIAKKDGAEVGYRSWRLTDFGSDLPATEQDAAVESED